MIAADKQTRPKRDLLDTSERNITAHLRNSLSKIGFIFDRKKYQVDHEYNRKGMSDKAKDLSVDCLRCLGRKKGYVVPDIVIHLRGITVEENNNANWLVIEVKNIPNFTGTFECLTEKEKDDLECDLAKLRCFKIDTRFQYKHAASVVFSKAGKWISLDDNIERKQFTRMDI